MPELEIAAIDKPTPASLSQARPMRAETGLSRRGFLLRAAGACTAVGVFAQATALGASVDPLESTGVAGSRSLRFVHTHTGETLTTAYFDGGAYNLAGLNDVNHLLRDFRTGESHVIDPPLLDILYELQRRADHDAPFEVISGYRSPATNAMLRQNSSGVAEHSQHLLGKAIDVRLSGYSTRRLSEHARALALGGVGFYASSDFVHIDTGRVRSW
ncbi:MAG: YcbK family protein [Steroidobacteraceae bacterium]|jgi:uncharacterized protein YcbK (DUF882 family)